MARKNKGPADEADREPAGAGADAVLDTTNAGSPFFPPTSSFGANLGGAAAGPAAPSPNEDVIIEVELAPGTSILASALTANLGGFLGGTASAFPPSSSMASVLRDFDLREAKAVFSRERVIEDEQQTNALRDLAALGAATQDQVSARERLPSLAQFVRLKFPPGTSAKDVTAALKRLPEVVRAVAVPRATPPGLSTPIPSDPLIGTGSVPLVPDPVTGFESQWYLHRARVPQAWRYARGANVVVADVDWGFRTTHQDLQPAIERTYNAVDGSANVTQGTHAAHGTAVLGLAAGRANGLGIAGLAPEAALWAVQGDSAPGPARFDEPWAEAIDFVRRTDSQNRRKVIIVEVQTGIGGNYEQIPSVHRAIRAAIADGCVVCVAAGNGNRPADRTDDDQPFDPTGSILVGATAYDDRVNKRASFSNHGSRIVVSAPGDPFHDLTCGQNADNAYRNGFGGTSGATPKVAGVAALMLSVNPALTHQDVRDILAGMGSALAEDPGKPAGVFLNAEASVAEALRRRSEGPSPDVLKPLHGVHRRKAQMVLPRDTGGPLTWDEEEEEEEDAGLETLGAAEVVAPAAGEKPPASGDKPLRVFRESVEGTLTQEDRILIVEQAIEMLDNFYVHRPLKEAMHAVRPIQRLRVLLRRLQPSARSRTGEEQVSSELAFHNTLTQIFNSVRDLHTSYQLPRPFRECIAYLPFEVASFHEDERRRYLVTRVVQGYAFAHPEFQPGVELLYWNGMAIDRAVRANGEQTAASNEAARHARGVSALTLRPMNTALPPEADFVDLEFVPLGADANDPQGRRQMRQSWFVRFAPQLNGGVEAAGTAPPAGAPPQPPPQQPPLTFEANALDLARESMARSAAVIFEDDPPAATPAAPTAPPAVPQPLTESAMLASVLGLDTAADAVREARQLIFEPAALRDLRRAKSGDEHVGIRGSASPVSASDSATGIDVGVKVEWTAAFRARKVNIDGVEYGHIHIRTFYFADANGFVNEFVRLLGLLPANGLILDVRGNGGGNILAAERLIQTLTPAEVDPERLQFIVTGGTLDLCRNNPTTSLIAPLDSWLPSLEEGVETGSVYSHAFPVTTKESCNAIGQKYYGPVVLLVDGNCYSATDIFAAGFQDHAVGKVLGVSNATGAGGANVWEHGFLTKALPSGWGLKPLPGKADMRVAIRQCLRAGGALLEDFGVVPDHVHPPTRADVTEGDRDLFAEAAKILREQPVRSIKVTEGNINGTNRRVEIETNNLRRIDFYINERPEGSRDLVPDASGAAKLGVGITRGASLRLIAYATPDDKKPAASYRGAIS